jgi:hypothetical protein
MSVLRKIRNTYHLLDNTIYCLKIQLSLTFSLLWYWRGNCTQPEAGFDPVWLREIESATFYILKNSKDRQLDMKGLRVSSFALLFQLFCFLFPLLCVPMRSLSLNENSFIARFGDRQNPGYSTSNHLQGWRILFHRFILGKYHSKTTAVTPGNFVCGNSRIKLRPSVLFLQKPS